MHEKTLDSLQTKLNQLQNAWNELILGFQDTVVKDAVDSLTAILGAVNRLTAALPPLLKVMARVGIAITAFKAGKALKDAVAK